MSSLIEAPVTSGEIALGTRKTRRVVETQEIRIRSTHRRRKVLTRGGVLAGFALAMVVYPVYGTITPYADASEALPGLVQGETPSTATALLGNGPELMSSDLPLPSIAAGSTTDLMSNEEALFTPLADCRTDVKISGTNGRLSDDSLCTLWKKNLQLQPDAAVAMTLLNDNFRVVFGRNLCVSSGYRTLADQFRTKATRGYLAATPGTSLHGWGIAVDICTEELKGSTGEWIRENATTYGWGNPTWARGSQYEPWHYEYIPAASAFYSKGWGILY